MKDKVKAVYEEVTEEGDEMEPLPADAVSNMYNTYNTYYNIFIYYNYVYKYTQAYYKMFSVSCINDFIVHLPAIYCTDGINWLFFVVG